MKSIKVGSPAGRHVVLLFTSCRVPPPCFLIPVALVAVDFSKVPLRLEEEGASRRVRKLLVLRDTVSTK